MSAAGLHAVAPARTGRARIIFLSRTFPHDFARATYGIYIRMRMLLESVRPLADALDVVFFVDPAIAIDEPLREATEDGMRRRWGIDARVVLIPERASASGDGAWGRYVLPALSLSRNADFSGTAGDAQAEAVVACLGPDVVGVFAHRLGSMWPLLRSRIAWPPVVLDLDDIEHRKLARMLHARPFYPGKLAAYLAVPALLAGEVRAVRRAQLTLTCSDADRRYLARLSGGDRIVTVPNVASFPAEAPPDPGTETLLFLASFTYAPNVDAADYLLQRLWPGILARRPHARLLVAGQRPERIRGYAAAPAGVTFTGFVDSLGDLYSQVRVVCCPIRSGGGTRIKIIEAAGYARPTVATPVGAEGLEFVPPGEIRIERSDAGFITACVELLGDPARAREVGLAAKRRAVAQYDRATVIARTREVIGAAFRGAARGKAPP